MEKKHSLLIRAMFMSVKLESAVFMGKNYSDIWHSIKNTKDFTMKQMFDISSKLVSEQDEISGLETSGWENHSWKYLSLIGEERVINLQRINVYVFAVSVLCQRINVYVFSVSVLCLGKIHENPRSNIAWEQSLEWFQQFTRIQSFGQKLTASQWKSSGVFSQDTIRCSSVNKFKIYC